MYREMRCDSCGAAFISEATDEATVAEHRAIFGYDIAEGQRAVLCEDCWERFIPWAQAQGLLQGGETQ